jgi:hypothetical protein
MFVVKHSTGIAPVCRGPLRLLFRQRESRNNRPFVRSEKNLGSGEPEMLIFIPIKKTFHCD